ncbi:uncharacterized protein LOC143232107 isoform X2 [Tachypleus tridentatus]|uniref:uncharacterized protein LOC143232107 isoform X2 n=1 Tax=Tachypleus tridentatus TaxID=6853 RepID=UPI003FD4B777
MVDLLQKCSIQDDVSSSQITYSAEARERGERNILAGISNRTRTLNYWLEELHAEQERSVEEVTQLKKSRNILQKVFRHTNLPLSVALACKRYRTRRVTNQQEVIDHQLDQEVAFLQAQQEKMTKFEEEMQSLQSKIENMELELRNCVLKKVDNLLVSQDCSRRDTSFRRNDNQSVTLGETVLQNGEQNAKERKNTLEEEHRKTEARTSELHEMKRSVEVKLDTVNKNLFIDRECCISLRKRVPVHLKLL